MNQVDLDVTTAKDGSTFPTFWMDPELWTNMGIEAMMELKEPDRCIWSEGNLKFQKRMDASVYVAEVLVAGLQVEGGQIADAMVLQIIFKEKQNDDKKPAAFQSHISTKRGGIKMGKSPPAAPSSTRTHPCWPPPAPPAAGQGGEVEPQQKKKTKTSTNKTPLLLPLQTFSSSQQV